MRAHAAVVTMYAGKVLLVEGGLHHKLGDEHK